MNATRRIVLVTIWVAVLVLLAFAVRRTLVVSNDLRSFMPPAQTSEQRLLLDQIGEGPASRLLRTTSKILRCCSLGLPTTPVQVMS